ncbi:hypothetical protein LX15_005110 [Streptoalloteichus tenebrarius]|uniref:Integral membrane protein MviN n=1 Tax=Streptoalloteichus tenebrarius (strain ATCC 17920 / DSM 40477 / JCM 4838 / CBS 697.72 / NBRC 16177 / NCIMB 11028 / NRRL B-12390 / A12253. 1 / ISP 5477) TaxID=1933 RepID=A0ABT1I0T8_STRSD|nr:protein kinase family protein [Streptoalloteichus tenebrarius]MCP2261384.1 hypothetical protein [Streptoalloteichus tenebrarius]BFF01987.1 protein kinase family protein [Streptoalloteichus tenebrarius]
MSGKPTESVTPRQDGGAPSRVDLTAGAILGEGRYRLLSRLGADHRAHAEFWRARDGALGRDVAMTVLVGSPSDPETVARTRKTLERTSHFGGFIHPGMARVLDVLAPGKGDPAGALGIIVAEWTQGHDLVDLVADGPLPAGTAARLLEPLAAAVEAAHHVGLVLGADHPQRIRVTPEGELRLAFPAPRPEATPRDDVRGVGAALYLMLTGRWALPGGPNSLPAAPTGPDGAVVAPRTLQPTVPHQLSTIAVRSLVDTSVGGVRTGAAILQVLEQAAAAEAETAMMRAIQERGEPAELTPAEAKEKARERVRRRKLVASVTVLALATAAVLVFVVMSAVDMFAGDKKHTTPPLVVGSHSANPAAPVGPAVEVAGVEIYNVKGTPDNKNRVDRVIDGDPETAWQTDTYRQQFPALKPGIGLQFRLREPTALSKIVVESPSQGTAVEVRAATNRNPRLDDTRLIGQARLEQRQTDVPITSGEPVQHVILWITELGGNAGKNATEISEVKIYARG